jgi:hypothetical protein
LLVVIWFSFLSTDVIGGAASYRHAEVHRFSATAEKFVFVATAPSGLLVSRRNTNVFVLAMSRHHAREYRATPVCNTPAQAVEFGSRD